jgi:hypothetical protein
MTPLPAIVGPSVRELRTRAVCLRVVGGDREQLVLDIDLAIAARRRWLRDCDRPDGAGLARWLTELGVLGDLRHRLDA